MAELGNIDSRSKTTAKIKIKTTTFDEMMRKMKSGASGDALKDYLMSSDSVLMSLSSK